jgi:hypothetical protein
MGILGKDTDRNTAADQAVQAQTDLANRLVLQSDPLRQQLFNQSQNFLGGDFDVTGTPQFAAGKDIQEQQFGRARDSIIGATPEGGALTSALTDLEAARASGLTQFTGGLAEAEQNRALQLGTFGAAQGAAGLQGAASTQAQLAAAEASANAGKAGGLGAAAGAIGAAAIKKK